MKRVRVAYASMVADTVTLTWATVVAMQGPACNPNDGTAGTMGQCGGNDKAK